MLLSIVIVNYRAPDLAVDCLRTMLGDSWNDLYEIIIVDNGSNDDSKEKVLAAFPRVIWLDTGYNAGFTRANNMGMRYAKGDTILLLNADTLPPNESVEQCYRRLYASDYVAAGIQLLNVDGTPQVSGMYVMKGGLNYLLPLPYMGSWIKTFGTLVGVKKPHVPGMAPDLIEVDWINGAFLMVKRSAIDKAGLMDEDFFLYAEEAEWCGRIARTGKMCIYGDLMVTHLQGETANAAFGTASKGYYNFYDKRGLQTMVSNFVRIRKQFGVFWFFVQLFFYLLDIPVFFFGVLFYRLFTGKSRYTFAQLKKYTKHLFVVVKLTPHILKNKPYFYKVL